MVAEEFQRRLVEGDLDERTIELFRDTINQEDETAPFLRALCALALEALRQRAVTPPWDGGE